MKRLLRFTWPKLFAALGFLAIVSLLFLFYRPQVLINKDNLTWLLQKEEVSEEVSWDELDVEINNKGLLKKEIGINADSLCLKINKNLVDLSFCLKARIHVTLTPTQWPFIVTPKKSILNFTQVQLHSWPKEKEQSSESESQNVNISKIWKTIWSYPIPRARIELPAIKLPDQKAATAVNITLDLNEKAAQLKALGVDIHATPKHIEISASSWSLNEDFNLGGPQELEIERFKTRVQMTEKLAKIDGEIQMYGAETSFKANIPSVVETDLQKAKEFIHSVLATTRVEIQVLSLKSLIDQAPLELPTSDLKLMLDQLDGKLQADLSFTQENKALKTNFTLNSQLFLKNKQLFFELTSHPVFQWQWPLDKKELMRSTLLATHSKVKLNSLRDHIDQHWPKSWAQLPSPFNNFNGPITCEFSALPGKSKNLLNLKFATLIKLSDGEQKLYINTRPLLTFNLEDGSLTKTDIMLEFEEVKLKLPHVYMAQGLPQVGPDSRIQNPSPKKPQREESKSGPPLDLDLQIKSSQKRPIKLSTNLIDVPLYIDLNLDITQGLPKGKINIRPFNTSIFKRSVELKKLRVSFERTYSPLLEMELHFPLPNYRIILNIDGPIDEPRPLLSSVPPLPEDDIISVLLFGQPLNGLSENEQATAAQQSSQILSQGLLSLSVLYFLSDTPIQSVGVDPETQKLSTQIGLGSKSSLNLSTQKDGTKSVGVRRSIGKGWFIDTSMQKSSLDEESDQKNYGVLLERIISY